MEYHGSDSRCFAAFLVPLGPGMCGETDRGARRDKA
jgi:hypothetical protein